MFPFRFMMHRKRGLRMVVLSMLSGGPRNGVELMDEIESTTRGWWRPSPGSIYPVLEQLAKDGLIEKDSDGRYELTDKANDQMEWSFGPPARRPQTVEDMVSEVSSYVSYFEELARSDRPKLNVHIAKLREVARRLSRLTE